MTKDRVQPDSESGNPDIQRRMAIREIWRIKLADADARIKAAQEDREIALAELKES